MLMDESNYLAHYGILRRSGRYPWGSGGNQATRNRTFLETIDGHRRDGMSDTEIARLYSTPDQPFTTTMLRAARSIAKNAEKAADIAMAQRLKADGWSNSAIGRRMGRNESSVRALLEPGAKDKADVLAATSSMLKDQVAEKSYVDIGVGVERHLGITQTKLSTAVARLQEEGYTVHNLKIEQLGTGKQTELKVLAAPGVTQREVWLNRHEIKQIKDYSEDGGRSYFGIMPPLQVNSKRIAIRYAEDGGDQADGVIYVRPGKEDLSLGKNHYAQVRIAVDGTHYLKGMAMYKDDLPPGVDLMFNTNKHNTGDKHDAMKPLVRNKETGEVDPDNPFGAVIRQIGPKDERGNTKKVTSAMNLVNEEADWETWSKSLSSQFLSKQSPKLAKQQLDMKHEQKQNELDEILKLSNPTVRKKLLDSFADGADASAVDLKAAHLPRQSSHVILPISSLKDNEIYAPGFNNGERVVLIRHPHGGVFEIPELTVNNRNREGRKLIGPTATVAVGINHKVAQHLSGADFDGDTVIVIPNPHGTVKTKPPLAELKNFDAKHEYPKFPGMRTMSKRETQLEMGKISNLITDMTIRGANDAEIARAVRHSMVVIDAEKHGLNWKQSEIDNGIANLKAKYQDGKHAGASTLISAAGSRKDVPDRRPRSSKKGGPIDRATGQLRFEPTGRTTTNKAGKIVPKMIRSTKLAETDDAHTLSSGTLIEKIYADHSNRMKALANQARKESIHTKDTTYSPSARKAYAKQVASLDHKLNIALRNAPLERQAQLLAGHVVSQKRRANPDMEDSEVKRIKSQALKEARARTQAKKIRVKIEPDEWEAIQAGAITKSKLTSILNNADLDEVKKLASPRTPLKMTDSKVSRARAMIKAGFTQAEIASQLGVGLTTLKEALK